ncbi:MAG TPA: Smr/MutS family protein [Candidatus Binataceae bacterium]|nr:Smr/MutS family protein [Candidatus Binataceae bacterium]
MAKKKKRGSERDHTARRPEPKEAFASPFRDLKKMLAERQIVAPAGAKKIVAPPPPPPKPEPVTENEEDIFRRAVEGVRPITNGRAARITPELTLNHTIVSEDAEVLAQLYDLVTGQGEFDITESDEYVEGARVGLDPRLSSRLRRGEYAMQAHIDLHGMIQPAAKDALRSFILDCVRKGLRAVLIVHGRGLGSPGGRPVLKHAVSQWLAGGLGGHVLAFTTARQPDGGAGAMYVLLRREKRRGPFDVLQGAKRRD